MSERSKGGGDEEASPVQRAFLKYERSIKRVIGRITRSREAAEDLAQDVFLRVVAAEHTTAIANAKAYVFEAARNAARSERSRRTRMILGAVEDAITSATSDHELSAEEVIIGRERLELFIEAVDQLPRQCRRVFVMCKVEGKSYREISVALDISESTVEKHIGTGLARCEAYMRRQELGMPQTTSVATAVRRRQP